MTYPHDNCSDPTVTKAKPGGDAETSITGTIIHFFYRSATFATGKLRRARNGGNEKDMSFFDIDDSIVKFAGAVFADLDVQIILHGGWVTDAKWGRQFKVASFEVDQQLDERGLANYLANNPAIAGVGPIRAQKIARAFGANFTVALRERPEQVAEVAGMPLEKILQLREEWDRTAAINATATKLAAYGLTHLQVTALVKAFGNGAVGIIEDNPYLMLGEIEGMGFGRVDAIARKTGVAKNHPGRIDAGIIYTVERAASIEGDGSTYVEWRDLVKRTVELLSLDQLDADDVVDKALTKIIDDGEKAAEKGKRARLVCVPANNRLLVAVPWLYLAELKIGKALARGHDENPHGMRLNSAWSEGDYEDGLTPGQVQALRQALEYTVTLVTGGAGTGKTYLIKRIVDLYEDAGIEVALCAPTGKAAKRVEQLVGRGAKTIHRLLNCQGPDAWPDVYPLRYGVVICDEASMVSSHLAWRLFRSIDLSRTAVILVGDHNQLPPVEAGNPLRDIIQRQAIPTTFLDTVMRQAGILKRHSLTVLEGRVEDSAQKESERPDGTLIDPPRSPWVLDKRTGPAADLAAYLVRLMENHIKERLGFDLLRDVQVLTPTHKGPLGDTALNVELQRVLQKKLWGFNVPPPQGKRLYDFHANDRVIHVKNNYDLGVMNGEVGKVQEIDEETNDVVVNYPDLGGGEKQELKRYNKKLCPECEGTGRADDDPRDPFSSESPCLKCDGRARGPLGQLQLAYALTIHKMQGSEIPLAIVVIAKDHSWQHHRNMLYTAVTRARQMVIILGDQWAMRNAAEKTKLDERSTFLQCIDLCREP